MKKIAQFLVLPLVLISLSLAPNKASAFAGIGLTATGNVVAGGILIALGGTLVAASGAITIALQVKTHGCEYDCTMRAYSMLSVAGVLAGIALLPTDDNGVEFTELDQNTAGIIEEDLEVYNYWSIPLTLKSRIVQEQIQNIIDQNPSLYDSEAKILELSSTIWLEQMTEMGISEAEQKSLKKVLLQNRES